MIWWVWSDKARASRAEEVIMRAGTYALRLVDPNGYIPENGRVATGRSLTGRVRYIGEQWWAQPRETDAGQWAMPSVAGYGIGEALWQADGAALAAACEIAAPLPPELDGVSIRTGLAWVQILLAAAGVTPDAETDQPPTFVEGAP